MIPGREPCGACGLMVCWAITGQLQVVTGTEMGTVLVWDDALVKCQLKRPGGAEIYCHQGMVEYLVLDEDARTMITAAADGYIRFWNLDVRGLPFLSQFSHTEAY